MLVFPDEFGDLAFSKTFLYTLSDPVTNEICYVGLTKDPAKRHKQHYSYLGQWKGNIRMMRWIRSLSEIEHIPIMTVIDMVGDDYMSDKGKTRERELIKIYWGYGHPLLNGERWMQSRKNNKDWAYRLNNSKWYRERCYSKREIFV